MMLLFRISVQLSVEPLIAYAGSATLRLYVKSQDPVQKSFKLKLSSSVSSPCFFELRQSRM